MIHPERDDWAQQLTAVRQQMAEQAASLDASGDFPGAISTTCARGLVKPRRAACLRRRGRQLAQLQQAIAAIAGVSRRRR